MMVGDHAFPLSFPLEGYDSTRTSAHKAGAFSEVTVSAENLEVGGVIRAAPGVGLYVVYLEVTPATAVAAAVAVSGEHLSAHVMGDGLTLWFEAWRVRY